MVAEVADRRVLYGSASGDWAILTPGPGLTGTSTVSVAFPVRTLTCLGTPGSVVRRLLGQGRAQAELAELMGVSQQAVSRYARGASAPAVADEGWRALVRAMFDA